MKISSMTYKKYLNKYGPYHKNDIIDIEINDLSKCCSIKVDVICDICGKESKITYQSYLIQMENGGYSCCQSCGIKKSIKTNQLKYGVDFPQQNKKIREKSLNTLLEKYGVNNISCLEETKDKKKETCLEKYGFVSYNQSEEGKEKHKNTCLKKYGVDNISNIDNVKKKKKETCLENYGVENPSQSGEIFLKSQISGKKIKYHENMNLYYRGTYEKDFLDYCFSNNIKVEKGLSISFKYKEKNKVYHSDFYIRDKNLIIEIKSSYYYQKYFELNIVKENETKKQGYDYKFILDKNYDNFLT